MWSSLSAMFPLITELPWLHRQTNLISKADSVKLVTPQTLNFIFFISFSQSALYDSSVFNGFWRDEGRGSTATICSGTSLRDTPPLARNIISCLVWRHVGYNQLHWRVEMLKYSHTHIHVQADMCAPCTNAHILLVLEACSSGWQFWLTIKTGSRKHTHTHTNWTRWL